METIVKPSELVESSSSRFAQLKDWSGDSANIAHYSGQGATPIGLRIRELDRIWNIIGALEVNAGVLRCRRYFRTYRRQAFGHSTGGGTLVSCSTFDTEMASAIAAVQINGIKCRPGLEFKKRAFKALRNDFKNVHNATQA